MAIKNGNNGTYNIVTSNQYISGYVEWTETYDDQTYISTNKTTVTQKVYLHRTNTYDLNYDISANGSRITYFGSEKVTNTDHLDFSIPKNPPGGYILVSTASKEITHDANGSKTITLGFEMSNSISLSGFIVSKTTSNANLMAIPRYATSNQSLASKTSSSITMNWSSDNAIDYIWYSSNNGSTWTGLDVTDGTSGSYTISGLAANTTYNIKTRVRRKDSQLTTDSNVLSVTTHAKTVPTITLSSKTINTITVTSGCNVTVSSTQYRIKTSNGSYGSYQTSATFSGLAANTTYVIEVYKVGTASGEAGTATLTVTTYQIATISSASNFNLGDAEAVSYSNPSGSTIAIGIYLTDATTALAGYRTASGSSYTFSFTDTELDTIYKKLGANNSMTVRIYLRTTCNGTNYYSTKDVTVTLTGNQKTAHIGVGGVQKRAKVFLGINGSVKRAVIWIGNNGKMRCI